MISYLLYLYVDNMEEIIMEENGHLYLNFDFKPSIFTSIGSNKRALSLSTQNTDHEKKYFSKIPSSQ